MFKGRARVLYLVVFVFSMVHHQSLAFEKTTRQYSSEALPSILITYNFSAGYYHDFQCLWDLEDPSHFIPKLYSEFERLSHHITHEMIFTHLAFIAQNTIPGHFSGFIPVQDNTSGEQQVPYESILFVTTPIESLGNSVLVILSSVSPEDTTIMKVDKELNVTLLYDAGKVKLPGGSICSIFALRIIQPGLIQLFERDRGRCAPPGSKRTFLIDVTSGEVTFSEGSSWGESEFP